MTRLGRCMTGMSPDIARCDEADRLLDRSLGLWFLNPLVEGESKRNGRYWTRTSDPCGVNTVLYQLS